MSTLRLSQKLKNLNYRVSVRALLLHEFSHLFGATEDEAVFIQQDFYDHDTAWNFNGLPATLAGMTRFYAPPHIQSDAGFFDSYRTTSQDSSTLCSAVRSLMDECGNFPERFGRDDSRTQSFYRGGSPLRASEWRTLQNVKSQMIGLEKLFCQAGDEAHKWMRENLLPESPCEADAYQATFSRRPMASVAEGATIYREVLNKMEQLGVKASQIRVKKFEVLIH